ncbi:MAG TPA: response regulator [Anaerolineaceae bacterium]|nr:response regulator [Anaerolineaceae bacterium]HPN53658.1 response regulator [Anaerolineaceae bacterium]
MADKTILYVEDDDSNRLLVRRLLQSEDYLVLEAENSAQALAILAKETPNLILMDINMPVVDGLMLTAQLRNRPELNAVPIVALTANVMKGDRERSFQAGCDGYIEKPINVDTFLEDVERFLKRKHGS